MIRLRISLKALFVITSGLMLNLVGILIFWPPTYFVNFLVYCLGDSDLSTSSFSTALAGILGYRRSRLLLDSLLTVVF